jgi:hypothetical protein
VTDPGEASSTGPGADSNDNDAPGDAGGNVEEAVQPSPAAADANASDANSEGDDSRDNPRNPKESGIGGGIVPWLLIALGVAAAGAGGITFYLIRAASREPY